MTIYRSHHIPQLGLRCRAKDRVRTGGSRTPFALEALALWNNRTQNGQQYDDGGTDAGGSTRNAAQLEEAAALSDQLKAVLFEALDESPLPGAG